MSLYNYYNIAVAGITTLIVASANIDVVIAISLFSVFLGLIFSDGTIMITHRH